MFLCIYLLYLSCWVCVLIGYLDNLMFWFYFTHVLWNKKVSCLEFHKMNTLRSKRVPVKLVPWEFMSEGLQFYFRPSFWWFFVSFTARLSYSTILSRTEFESKYHLEDLHWILHLCADVRFVITHHVKQTFFWLELIPVVSFFRKYIIS